MGKYTALQKIGQFLTLGATGAITFRFNLLTTFFYYVRNLSFKMFWEEYKKAN